MRKQFFKSTVRLGFFPGLLVMSLSVLNAEGQPPTQAPAVNLLKDANAEQTQPYQNLWDGINAAGELQLRTETLPALPEGGGTSLVATPISVSPSFVDMNDDGLKDLVVGDPAGYIWIYLNSGEPGAPVFTTGTFLHTFSGFGSKVHATDWDGDHDIDLVIGSFYGDVVVLENTGNRQKYIFAKKMGVPRYVDPRFRANQSHRLVPLKLGKRDMVLGNYMAPWVVDWNVNGKKDLLLGEGTYSANGVRLLINTRTVKKPGFVKDKTYFLAWGEGREHLTPAVLDYNGDGINDLIMGSRSGHFRLHKGTGKTKDTRSAIAAFRGRVPPPALMEMEQEFKIKGVSGMSIAYPCNWNEDGLIDLLVGGPDGRIKIALNQGTKEKPSYTGVEVVKGTDTKKNQLRPSVWTVPNGFHVWGAVWIGGVHDKVRRQSMSNSAFMLTAETQLAVTGGQAVKAVEGSRFIYFRYVDQYPGWVGGDTQGGRILIFNRALPLKIKKKYKMSFSRFKGKSGMEWSLNGRETVEPGTEETPPQYGAVTVKKSFGLSSTWSRQEWTFRLAGKNKDQVVGCYLFITLPSGECELGLDDFSLVELP